jgi:hypothetical protein
MFSDPKVLPVVPKKIANFCSLGCKVCHFLLLQRSRLVNAGLFIHSKIGSIRLTPAGNGMQQHCDSTVLHHERRERQEQRF